MSTQLQIFFPCPVSECCSSSKQRSFRFSVHFAFNWTARQKTKKVILLLTDLDAVFKGYGWSAKQNIKVWFNNKIGKYYSMVVIFLKLL